MLLDLLSNANTSYILLPHTSCLSPTWLVCLQFCEGPQLALVNHHNSVATKVYVELVVVPSQEFQILQRTQSALGKDLKSQKANYSSRHNYKVGNLRFKGRSKFPTCFQICPLNFCSTTKCTSHIARALHVEQLLHNCYFTLKLKFSDHQIHQIFSLAITFFSSHLTHKHIQQALYISKLIIIIIFNALSNRSFTTNMVLCNASFQPTCILIRKHTFGWLCVMLRFSSLIFDTKPHFWTKDMEDKLWCYWGISWGACDLHLIGRVEFLFLTLFITIFGLGFYTRAFTYL